MICENLLRADLKSFRLVSRNVKGAAEAILYGTINLSYNLRSFERCQHIANHEEYQKHVRYLDYDVTSFRAKAFAKAQKSFGFKDYLGFESWAECYMGTSIDIGYRERDSHRDRFLKVDGSKLMQSHEAWRKWMRGELYLSTGGTTKTLLAALLPKLSGLVGFGCGSRLAKPWYNCDDTLPFESLNPIAQEMLCEPTYTEGYYKGQFHFWDLFKSISETGLAYQLRDVSVSGIRLKAWDKGVEDTTSYVDSSKFLSGLKTLSLKFTSDETGYPTANLSNIIRCSSSLRSLLLSFDELEDGYRLSVRLSDIINQAQHWEYLRELSLEAFITTEKDLCLLLSMHGKTLRSLALSNVEFRGPEPRPVQQSYGSWVSVFEFLNNSMALEHAKFDGTLTNKWDEAWVTGNQNDRRFRGIHGRNVLAEYPPDCLRYGVERFATRKGPFPFTRNLGAISPYLDARPWQRNYDMSWRFERCLLP